MGEGRPMTRLKSFFFLIGGALLAIFAAFGAGKRSQRKAQQVDELNEFIETKRRIDNAEIDTPDGAFKRLHQRKSDRNL